MKRISSAFGAYGGLAGTSAFGADIPRPPGLQGPGRRGSSSFTWTGFYVGGFGGGACGSEDPTDLNEYGLAGSRRRPARCPFHTWLYD